MLCGGDGCGVRGAAGNPHLQTLQVWCSHTIPCTMGPASAHNAAACDAGAWECAEKRGVEVCGGGLLSGMKFNHNACVFHPPGMFIFGNCLPMTFENRVGAFYGQCPSDDTHGGDDQNDQLDDNDEEAEKSVPIVGGGGLGPRTL